MRSRRPSLYFLHCLLALLLLVSQQIGVGHLIAHGVGGSVQSGSGVKSGLKSGTPDSAATAGKSLLEQACPECLFLAHFGLALSGSQRAFDVGLPDTVTVSAVLIDAPLTHSPSPYLSRAPPV